MNELTKKGKDFESMFRYKYVAPPGGTENDARWRRAEIVEDKQQNEKK